MCLSASHSAGWSAWRYLSWTASVPGECSVGCCAWGLALGRQPGPLADPSEAACDWSSGAGSERAGGVRRN